MSGLIAERKDSHLSICLDEEVDLYSESSNGLEAYRFEHDALPEIDFSSIRTDCTVLGRPLAAPLLIGAMTGGTERAGEINRRLALAAQECRIGLALGSQRKMLNEARDSRCAATYDVRRHAPKIPLLLGNLGAVQLNYGVGTREIRELIESTGCDAFNFHLNPLQEAIQPEGDRNFADLAPKLRDCIPQLGVPVLIKEVGSGLSSVTAKKLKTLPIAGVETAGVGGTSWAKIEGLRSRDPSERNSGELFARWGVPTAESILSCRSELPHHTIIASGGLRNGIEIAKSIALGADAAALALPILKAAEKSADHAIDAIEALISDLKIVMFITGIKSIEELKRRGRHLLRKAAKG